MGALYDHGYRVPKDISVIGLDGLGIGAMYRPALTSISQPCHDLARQAVERLLQIVNQPGSHIVQGKIYLRPELVLRSSTAAFVPK